MEGAPRNSHELHSNCSISHTVTCKSNAIYNNNKICCNPSRPFKFVLPLDLIQIMLSYLQLYGNISARNTPDIFPAPNKLEHVSLIWGGAVRMGDRESSVRALNSIQSENFDNYVFFLYCFQVFSYRRWQQSDSRNI